MMTGALLTNRDGIVGKWQAVAAPILPNPQNDIRNLDRLAPSVRSSIFGFDLVSQLGFSFASGEATVWHVDGTPTDFATPNPYLPIVRMTAPEVDTFRDLQLPYLDSYAALREDRAAEILAQLPAPTAFLASIAFMEPSRTPHTLELMNVAQGLAIAVEMQFKYALACKRPIEFSPQVQPLIVTPTHGSLPSGHATEAFTLARVLWLLLQDAMDASASPPASPYADAVWGEMLMRQAARIAVNRTVAGVHFPVDSIAGAVLGLTLGLYLAERCGASSDALDASGRLQTWSFDGVEFGALKPSGNPKHEQDFDWTLLYDPNLHPRQRPQLTSPPTPPEYVTPASFTATKPMVSEPLHWLWEKARDEWVDLAAGSP